MQTKSRSSATTREMTALEPAPQTPPVAQPSVIEIDPSRTRMNDLHRRSPVSLAGAAIDDMVEMFKATGQLVPALGWRVSNTSEGGHDLVLVYGARRRAAALVLGCPLKVELLASEPSPTRLAQLMHGENRARLGYLPLEDAKEYRAYLDNKIYRTAHEMAFALGVSSASVSRTLSLLELPAEVLSLYKDPSWLPMVKGNKLASVSRTSKAARAKLITAARDWEQSGGCGNPTSALLKAIDSGHASASQSVKLAAANGRVVGTQRGNVYGGGTFTVSLGPAASSELRSALALLLASHLTVKGSA